MSSATKLGLDYVNCSPYRVPLARLAAAQAAQKRFRLLLKPGKHARATITVRAADKEGHTSTARRTVAVRR